MECKGSIESRFAWFIQKLAEDSGKLGVYFVRINSTKFGGCSAYSNACGCRSTNKKSGLGNKLITIVDCGSLGTTSLSLASGCLKIASATRTIGSLGRKNRTLLATTRAVSSTVSLENKMWQESKVD